MYGAKRHPSWKADYSLSREVHQQVTRHPTRAQRVGNYFFILQKPHILVDPAADGSDSICFAHAESTGIELFWMPSRPGARLAGSVAAHRMNRSTARERLPAPDPFAEVG